MIKTLKPAEGCLVRHPGSYKPLDAEGESVEMNSYWQRKLTAGDVLEVTPQKTAGAK